MNIPSGLRYTKDHEWVQIEGGSAVVGITDYAQHELGDIVFVEMPKPNSKVEQGKACASIEAVKAVSDVFAPMSGEVVETNDGLEASPQSVNQDPYGKGWIFKLRLSNPKEADSLLSPEDYQKLIG
jgi:glycine cleavage system H protein